MNEPMMELRLKAKNLIRVALVLGVLLINSIAVCGQVTECTITEEKPAPLQTDIEARRGGNDICLKASLKAYLKIGDDKYVDLKDGQDSGSKCDSKLSSIVIGYQCANIQLSVYREIPDSRWLIRDIYVHAGINGTQSLNTLSIDGMGVRYIDHAYRCESEQTIILRQSFKDVEPINLILSGVTIEPYRDGTKSNYYQTQDLCEKDLHGICPLRDTIPEPSLIRVPVRSPDSGYCIIALFRAYIKVGSDKYIELGYNPGVQVICPGYGNADNSGTFVVSDKCGTFTFHIYREDSKSPLGIRQIGSCTEVAPRPFGK